MSWAHPCTHYSYTYTYHVTHNAQHKQSGGRCALSVPVGGAVDQELLEKDPLHVIVGEPQSTVGVVAVLIVGQTLDRVSAGRHEKKCASRTSRSQATQLGVTPRAVGFTVKLQ